MELLKRPELDYEKLAAATEFHVGDQTVAEQVQITAKYEGYIARQQDEIEKLRRNENTLLPDNLDYDEVKGLSNEVKQKLKDSRPNSIGQASRVPGVTPAALSILLIHLKKRTLQDKKTA
jgi:tRNA uridine 5-carboxymethylaminomethyl modification enzyme